jgi:adenosine kinase
MADTSTCQLFCLGQPLLDMQVTDGENLLRKYDLKPDDGILAQDKHASMYVCSGAPVLTGLLC